MSLKETVTPVKEDVVHQPDFQFAAWCLRQYGINRGVYNTIDDWLFRFGMKDIVSRRMMIISFLTQVRQSKLNHENSEKIKFGKGLLVAALTRFLNKECV
ncbi:hypothetical protein [Laceyella putida]|uniref:RNA-binding protein n=1 Tax=Laceyella putida TaxID=110101 RepID=A0ABW2RKV3_9BACL